MFRSALILLGLLAQSAADWRSWRTARRSIDEGRLAELITARTAARNGRNWTEADRLRAEIDAMGVELKDGPDGTTWEAKRCPMS